MSRVALAYNNVYLVESEGERLLVDCGPDYRGAFQELQEAIDGRAPAIAVATHAHLDHAGLGSAWQASGVAVAVGEEDAPLVTMGQLGREGEFGLLAEYAAISGAPRDVVAEAVSALEQRRAWARLLAGDEYPAAGRPPRWPTGLRYRPFVPDRLLKDGDVLPAGLRVVACPGHTPGNLVLIHEAEGWLFSGDQLLPDLTPVPAVQANPSAVGDADWRFRSLPAFVRSLQALQEWRFERCFPGHGEPFDDVGDAIAANLAAIEARTERVAAELEARGPSTPFALADQLYPRALRRRFWQIIATVQGHLDLLEDAGRVLMVDGRYETRA